VKPKNNTVIIVAGGKGERMGNNIPKQFLLLNGYPVLMHTINKFYTFDDALHIILVLPKNEINTWNELCKQYNYSVNHAIVEGGKTRYHSVKNALKNAPDEGLIAIHDGVRPLVNHKTIKNCYETAAKKSNAIPVSQVFSSMRMDTSNDYQYVDRNQLKMVQTPQIFENSLIKKAYQQHLNITITDDGQLIELMGYKIHMVEGNPENIKITTPIDLMIAETLLTEQEDKTSKK